MAAAYEGLDIQKVVAIDFGSFGFASCFAPPHSPKDQRMVEDWSINRTATDLNKNLAALLIDKKTKQTVAIGYDAEEQYAKAIEKKDGDRYMYFQHFKPYLYSKDHLKKNIEVQSADGKSSLPLSELITKSFEAVIGHSLKCINAQHKLLGIPDLAAKDIYWVMSVPAIWDEMSKEMMKYCAKKAGMRSFSLGSEPICTVFHVIHNTDIQLNNKGSNKFIVLDCGGGTIDASCIEISIDEQYINELHFGEGIFCGGLRVDEKFISLIEELLPDDVINTIKDTQRGEWVRQRQEFVTSKFNVPLEFPEYVDAWNVEFCYFIKQWLAKKKKQKKKDKTYKELQSKVKKYLIPNIGNNKDEEKKGDDQMVSGAFKLGNTNIKIKKGGWLWLHEEVLSQISDFLRKLCNHAAVSNCNNIILSGGFANSEYLKDRLFREFPNKTFLVPKHPHLAVVKGALYWVAQSGKNDAEEKKADPVIIDGCGGGGGGGVFKLKKTRAKYSYGIAIDRKWKDTDDIKRRKEDDHEDLGGIVENAFGTLVSRNEEYEDGYTEEFDYWIQPHTKKIDIALYASEDQFCRYVFEEDGVTLPTEEGQRCVKVKNFPLTLNEPCDTRQEFKITLEYRQDGINLSFIDPNDGERKNVEVDTNAKPGSDKE